jgi:XTP/dITP diphosphohydrolase
VQSDDVAEIARRAALETFEVYHKPLFVEDTGLSIHVLNGFPGTYGAYVFRTIGLVTVLKLIGDAEDRSAEFVSAVAYCENNDSGSGSIKPRLFIGRLKGEIAKKVRGKGGFGFDPIFVPEGKSETLAEMSIEEKCALSHRAAALNKLARWLKSRKVGQPL